jgi:hypothetical protein
VKPLDAEFPRRPQLAAAIRQPMVFEFLSKARAITF